MNNHEWCMIHDKIYRDSYNEFVNFFNRTYKNILCSLPKLGYCVHSCGKKMTCEKERGL